MYLKLFRLLHAKIQKSLDMTKKTSKNFSLYNIFCNFAADFAPHDNGWRQYKVNQKHHKLKTKHRLKWNYKEKSLQPFLSVAAPASAESGKYRNSFSRP